MAKLSVKYINFPFLMFGPRTFFAYEKHFSVDKLGVQSFEIFYTGDKPKLFYLNMRPILITPGDNVSIEYNRLNPDPDNHRDTLMVTGSNIINYVFSNFIDDRMPKSYYPDYKKEIYKNNIPLLAKELDENNKRYYAEVKAKLFSLKCNEELSDFILRKTRQNYLDDLMTLEKLIVGNVGQLKLLTKITDSVFNKMEFLEKDIFYDSSTEITIKNYLSRTVVHNFSNLKTENNFSDLVNYINNQPNKFIKDYFIYFLSTEFEIIAKKYNSSLFADLLMNNPLIGKNKRDELDKADVFQ